MTAEKRTLESSPHLDMRLGNTPRWYISRRKGEHLRVPDEIRDCVVFIALPEQMEATGESQLRFKGTGFFVDVPSERYPEERAYRFLVTAAHVAQELHLREFVIRMNNRNGGSELLRGSGGERWWYHPTDNKVDVAALAWVPDTSTLEYRSIPLSMFLDDEAVTTHSIGVGDEVFLTGLFAHMIGRQRNLPIVRMGNISMMPTEPVPTRRGEIDAYLIEARSIGGLSGSPAFVRASHPLNNPIFLLGLVHGHWDVLEEDRMSSSSHDIEQGTNRGINVGVAIVVPSRQIREVLMQPAQLEIRRQDEEEMARGNAPTLDATTSPRPEMGDR